MPAHVVQRLGHPVEVGVEQIRVDPQRHGGVLVAEHPGDREDVRPGGHRQRRAGVPQIVRGFLIGDVAVDPVDRIWGVDVVETTACPAGEGWLLDTTKLGRLAVRETLALRIGYSGTDFVQNVLRYVAEERCVLTVERPAAVLHITTLPTVLATETKSRK